MSQGKKTALLAARTGEEAHNAKTGAITLRTGYRIREQLPKRQQTDRTTTLVSK